MGHFQIVGQFGVMNLTNLKYVQYLFICLMCGDMVTMSQIKMKSDLNGNYHVDSRVSNSEIYDPHVTSVTNIRSN